MKKLIPFICVFLFLANTALAMTGVEFLRIDGTPQESATLEPIVIEFVAQGYKKVPKWSRLSIKMADIIRERGLAKEDINKIAIDAAKELGMTK